VVTPLALPQLMLNFFVGLGNPHSYAGGSLVAQKSA
jgi:hypothetical protein